MNDIPEFEDALSSFPEFLRQSSHPTDIVWVFRDDLWQRSISEVFIRVPLQQRNSALAKKVFEEGRTKGLVDINARRFTYEGLTAAF